jgi:hypothetical protein
MIKHLVLSGGGPTGFVTYGAAKQLAQAGFWKLSQIESIYGCSAGAYLGVILALGYPWTILDDYLIQRPWENLVEITGQTFFAAYEKKGLISQHFFEEAINPLLNGKDLSPGITLKEFYAVNKIEIHLFTTNINTAHFQKVDLSYLTHPDLPLVQALHMSMAVPFIFQPVFLKEDCYIDGGLMNNFPLNDCLNRPAINSTEILAFKNIWFNSAAAAAGKQIGEKSTIFDFFLCLVQKMKAAIDTETQQPAVLHTVYCPCENMENIDSWLKAVWTKEMRAKLINDGCLAGSQAEATFAAKIKI